MATLKNYKPSQLPSVDPDLRLYLKQELDKIATAIKQLNDAVPGQLLNTLTGANVAALTDTTSITDQYGDYLILLDNIWPGTANAIPAAQVFASGAWQTTNYVNVAGGATTYIDLANGTAQASGGPGGSGFVFFHGPQLAQPNPAYMEGKFYGYSAGIINTNPAGFWNGAAKITGVRFIMSTGNIYGTVKIYGLR